MADLLDIGFDTADDGRAAFFEHAGFTEAEMGTAVRVCARSALRLPRQPRHVLGLHANRALLCTMIALIDNRIIQHLLRAAGFSSVLCVV